MITHFGLLWSANLVFWGKRGRTNQPGQLLGKEGPKEAVKDYREFVGVYCLYAGNTIVYIGQAGLNTANKLLVRIRGHLKDQWSGKWDKFSWFGCATCAGQCDIAVALSQTEAMLISALHGNANGKSGPFKTAKRVHQVAHPDSEGDIDTKIKRLTEEVRKLAAQMSQMRTDRKPGRQKRGRAPDSNPAS